MGALGRILAFIVMGTVGLLTIATPIYMIAFASQIRSATNTGGATALTILSPFLVIAAIAAVIVIFAPTARHAWGRLALVDGLGCFALPFMAALFSWTLGSQLTHNIDGGEAAAVGAGLAGVVVTGAAGFVGFFAGLILVIMAYFILRGARKPIHLLGAATTARLAR